MNFICDKKATLRKFDILTFTVWSLIDNPVCIYILYYKIILKNYKIVYYKFYIIKLYITITFMNLCRSSPVL